MGDVLLDAHGTWDPAVKDKPAYALVPRSSRLLYFTENLKLFLDSKASREAILKAEPSQTVEGFQWAQNYKLTPAPEVSHLPVPDGFDLHKTVTGERWLCTSDKCGQQGWHNCAGVFGDSDMQDAKAIYFAVCRAVDLKPVGDRDYYEQTGVNQSQTNIGAGALSFEVEDDTNLRLKAFALFDEAAALETARKQRAEVSPSGDEAGEDEGENGDDDPELTALIERVFGDLGADSIKFMKGLAGYATQWSQARGCAVPDSMKGLVED